MLSLIYNAIQYALEYKHSRKDDIDDLNNVIARIENAYEKSIADSEVEYLNKDDYHYREGTVTFIATDYVLIDDRYVCNKVDVTVNDLRVGNKVRYMALRKSYEEDYKIRKIFSLVDKSERVSHDPQLHTDIDNEQMLQKSIIAKVVGRKNRQLFVDPGNISVDLNKVQSEFIPVIGDWLKLETVVAINENSVDLAGQVLKITKIQPLRSNLDIGVVSSYDPIKESGVIGNKILFHKRICDTGYIPCVGDKVVSDNIECDQGMYTWRSLIVVPMVQVPEKRVQLPVSLISQIKMGNLYELLKDKSGIVITDNLNVDLTVQDEQCITVVIKNMGNESQILREGSFGSRKDRSQVSLVQPINPDINSVLSPSESISYTFKCKAEFVGTSEELFVFHFQGFEIGRIFHITVRSKSTSSRSNSVPSKTDNTRRNGFMNVTCFDELDQAMYIPGIRPYKPASFIKVRNVVFKVPRHYWDIALRCMNEQKSQIECEQEIEKAIPCFMTSLSFQTYKDRFHALLYFEEIAQTINIQQYDMSSAVMRPSGEYLVMQVPGLAEKRPSLLVGDRAIVSFKWDDSQGKLKYEGFIHRLTSSEIYLKFNQRFHEDYNNEECLVTFKCSQLAIQRCHNAVNVAINRLGPNFLFPTHVIERKAQLNLDEIDTKADDTDLRCKRTDSMSSGSTCNTSTSNKSSNSTKSSKMSVVERLFSVKPIEQDISTTEIVKPSIITNSTAKSDVVKKGEGTTIPGEDDRAFNDNNTMPKSPIDSNNTKIEAYISQVKNRKLIWFNKNLNYYQKEAVRNILKGYGRPLPYVIFGPPGTGKTVTLCETILQIFSTIPESRLLIATPSNSSANLIAERLLDSGVLKPGDMVRLIAHHCLNSDSIPGKLLPYCATAELSEEGTYEKRKYNGQGPRINCGISVLGRHRITIGTCIALGVLHNIGFPHGHFSHVLIDEAGQATEPECLIPLNFIQSDHGQVILAGDPMQLGPVVQSKLAKSFGLDESFLVRLLRHFPYQKDPSGFETCYDPRLVTKLVINYRSLPEILKLPSSLFYDSELQAQISSKRSKEAELVRTLAPILPERERSPPAMIFHGVNGENCRDNDSPSWYNPEEATQVYLYLLKLYKFGLSPDDIGIITPYQKQVYQIRDLLLELDVELPKIGSVEGFQGQERKVIIISAVRSSNNFVSDDIKHSLGFVACPRRLNVAITRARALLIIVGNPTLLAQDPYWRNVLIYCADRAAYTGCTFFSSDMEADGAIISDNS